MKRVLTLLIALILILGISALARSADIDTSVSDSQPTGYAKDRRIAKSSNGSIVVLYQGGSSPAGIRAKKSSDNGTTWTNLAGGGGSTQIDSSNTRAFGVCLDASDNIYVAYETSNQIYFRKLTYSVSASSWTVGQARWVAGDGEYEECDYPSVIRESGGRVWVAYYLYDTDWGDIYMQTKYSNDDFATTGTTENVDYEWETGDNPYFPALTLRNGYPFLVYEGNYGYFIKWSYWNGSTWSSPATISSVNSIGSGDFSVSAKGNDVHLVYRHSGAGIKHTYYNGTSWSTPEILSTGNYAQYDRNPSLTTNNVDLWCFASIYNATNQYNIKYKRWSNSTWYENWVAITIDNAKNLYSTTPSTSTAYAPLVWTYGTASPYTVKFDSSVAVVVDQTKPAAITTLSALTGDYEGEIKLSWSAPGDDDWDGDINGGAYGLKWSTDSAHDWNGASNFNLQWATSTSPGNQESKVVTGLTPGATYYFRIWTRDEAINWSDISNGATTWARVDDIAPAAITNLSALTGGNGGVDLTWTAPKEDGSSGGKVSAYDLRYATSSFGNSDWSSSWVHEATGEPSSPKNPGETESMTVYGLTPGTSYWFRIKSEDNANNISPIDSTTPQANAVAGSQVGPDQVNHSQATGMAKDRHVVKSSDGTVVILYQGGSSPAGIRAKKTSDDGITWTNLGGASGSTQVDTSTTTAFSLCLDASDNIYVVYQRSDDIYFRKLTYWVSGSTWTVGTERSVEVDGKSSYNPTIIREDNGKIWVGYGHQGVAGGALVRTRYSDDEFATEGTIENVSSAEPAANPEDYFPALTLRSGSPFIVYQDNIYGNVKWSSWNGSSWSSPATISDVTPDGSGDFSVTLTGSDVHLVYNHNNAGIKYTYYNGSSWSSPEALSTSISDQNPSLTTNNVDLWCFVSIFNATNQYNIKYKKKTNSTWDSSWTAITTDNARNLYSTTPSTSTVYVPLAWTSDEPVQYTVKFDSSVAIPVDNTKPAAITNLSALTGDYEGEIKLSWSAPGDDDWDGDINGGAYGLKWSTDSAHDWDGASNFNLQWTTSTSPGNQESKVITGLTAGTTYYFRIWTRDDAGNWSDISNGATTWVQIDNIAPAAITNLSALTGNNNGEINLTWTAPKEDGTVGGVVSSYDVRYGTSAFGDSDWNSSWIQQATGEPSPPKSPGNTESMTVYGLTPGTTYWFRIKSTDNANNTSPIDTTSPQANAVARSEAGADYINDPQATGYAKDRHIVKSSNGTLALLYQGGSSPAGIRAKRSTNDGVTWTDLAGNSGQSTQISTSTTREFSICLDSSDNIYVAYEANNDIYFRKLTYSASASTWTAGAQKTVEDNASSYYSSYPSIIWESDTGYVWVAYGYGISGASPQSRVRSRYSSGSFDSWTLQNVSTLVSGNYKSKQPALTIRNNNPFIVYQDTYTATMSWSSWNGSSWSSPSSISGVTPTGPADFSVTLITTTVHLAYNHSGAGIKHTYYNGSSWSTPTELSTDTKDQNPSLTTNNVSLWCFASIYYSDPGSSYKKFNIKYKKRGDSTWDSDWTAITSDNAQNRYSTTPSTSTQYVPLAWTSDKPQQWTIRFNKTVIADETPPEAVTTLTALTGTASGTIGLSWISPGDDGWSGTLDGEYKIQYATFTSVEWSTSSAQISISTSSVTPLTWRYYTVTGLTSGSTYYFRIWTRDEVHNWSGLSNGATAQTWGFDGYVEPEPGWGTSHGSLAWGDYDNDGDLDLAVCGGDGSTGRFRVYKNKGDGTFDSNEVEPEPGWGVNPGSLAWGDYDNDGDLDLAVTGYYGSGNYAFRVYKNKGDGTFDSNEVQPEPGWGVYFGFLAWGDYDNDGDLDLAVMGSDGSWTTRFRVYKNNGDGTFDSNEVQPEPGWGVEFGSLAWGDYDNDGDLDLAVNGEGPSAGQYRFRVYKNKGDGTFAGYVEPESGWGTYLGSVVWGDYDNDGDLDLAVSGNSSGEVKRFRVYKNNGNGTFDSNEVEPEPGWGTVRGSLSWGDYDNDGDLDLAISGSDGSGYRFRVYRNNGDGTFDSNEIEPELGWGVDLGSIAWGDYDNDGDLDLAVSGRKDSTKIFRIYKNNRVELLGSGAKNQAPGEPQSLSVSNTQSGVEFTWSDASDGSNDPDSLYYNVWVSTLSGNYYYPVSPKYGSPLLGNYLRPKLSNSQLGVKLKLAGDATYYFSVQAIDVGLSTGPFTTAISTYVALLAPSPVSNLQASTFTQIKLNWTVPWPQPTSYDIRFSTTAAIENEADFTSATQLGTGGTTANPEPDEANSPQILVVTGLVPDTTYWWAMKSSNSAGTSELDDNGTYGEPYAIAGYFGIPVEPEPSAGVNYSSLAWGNYDNDGDLDLAVCGFDGSDERFRVYKNNGNGTFNSQEVEPEPGWGVHRGSLAWGDYDNDGDLDLAVSGYDNIFNFAFRVYKNNGDGTFDSNEIEPEPGKGVADGSLAWEDYDNDGDLDLAVCGWDGNGRRFRVYKNNGDGTFDSNEIEPEPGWGVEHSSLAWGDYDNDGDLDLAVCGNDGNGRRFRVYRNNGDGTFSGYVEPEPGWGVVDVPYLAWGDYDNDGDLDLAVCGRDSGNEKRFRVYRNNGNGTFDSNEVEPESNWGVSFGSLAWGDLDNDGDLDLAVCGNDGSSARFRVYRNKGDGTFDSSEVEPEPGWGAYYSSLVWADFDNDGDLDLAVSGWDGTGRRFRVYPSFQHKISINTSPSQPTSLTSSFEFSGTSVSTATFKWDWSTYGHTDADEIYFNLQIATAPFTTPPSHYTISAGSATPLMGNYLRPPKGGDNKHYVRLVSTEPWNSTSGLRTDTTYYWKVQGWDTGLNAGPFSSQATLWTGVAPAAITTISATTGEQITLSWSAPGDDNWAGTISTGKYRIDYTTDSSKSDWDKETYKIEVTTYNVNPQDSQSCTITGLKPYATYYFRIWTADEVGNWSGLSSGATTWAGQFYVVWNSTETEDNWNAFWGDFNGDGLLDFVVSRWSTNLGYKNRLYKNNGDGTFTVVWSSDGSDGPGAAHTRTLAGGDYDNDGDLDLYWGNDGGKNYVYRNDGNFNFTYVWQSNEADDSVTQGVDAWGDYDNDGDVDILVSNYGPNDTNRVYRNDGNNSFTLVWTSAESTYARAQGWGDYDNDGDLDILTSGGIYRNDGNDTFSWTASFTNGRSAKWGDYNEDGWLDIAVVYNNAGSRIYKNNGNGTFTNVWTANETDGDYYGLAWGDYDNDGDLDFLIGGFGAKARLYENKGADNFSLAWSSIANYDARYVSWADYDNDGDLDFIVCTSNAKPEYVYRNMDAEFGIVNSTPTAPTTGFDGSYSGGYITLKWNKGTDTECTDAEGDDLYYAVRVTTYTSNLDGYVSGKYGTPLLGNYLRPKLSSTQLGLRLKTLQQNNTTYYWYVRTIDTGLKASSWSSPQTVYIPDPVPPAAITDLTGLCDSDTGYVTLSWSTPGDDGWSNTLASGSKYIIDYSTYSVQWSTTSYKVDISTSGVAPHTQVSHTITGLAGSTTWYFQIWTRDEVPNWSGLSNGATVWVNPIISVSISTDTYNFGELTGNSSAVSTANITVSNDGNVTETYSIKCSSSTGWTPDSSPGIEKFTLQTAFHPSQPNNDDISWKAEDVLTESLQKCTTAVFSIDNSQNGVNVPAFQSNIKDFWLRIKTPLSTATTTQQSIKVTISAEQGTP